MSEVLEQGSDAFPCLFDGSLCGFSQQRFQFGEHLLDGIEIGAVRRQKEQLCTGLADGAADRLSLMAIEIIHDHDVAGFERGNEELLDISQEAFAIDGAVKDHWRINAIGAQRRQEGESLPVAMRHFCVQGLATCTPAAQPRHIGFGRGLIKKDQPRRIKLALMGFPPRAFSGDVGTVLFGGEQGFF